MKRREGILSNKKLLCGEKKFDISQSLLFI